MPLSIVEEEDGRIAVSSPYHPNFLSRARSLGGIWNAARRVWVFDSADHDRVRLLCREIYGTDGTFPNAVRHGRNEFAESETTVPHYYGHRRRLRERMIAAGAENLPDYELLEMLLFAANPQGDVKPAAKSLLAHFGGFGKVMSADPEALSEAGLGLAGVAAIKSVREAALRLMRLELQERPVVNSWDKLIDYCNAQVAHNKVEEFHILFLDRKNVLIKHERQQRGTIDHYAGLPARGRQARARSRRRGDDPGAQPPLGRPDPIQGRHRRDPGHQKSCRPTRRRTARPCHHRPQPPHQPARFGADLT